MSVPKMTQLYRGAPVNIILKANQRTGQLTRGQVADFLTRGDHPRGIKVRLADGQIGRVQSLATPSSSVTATVAQSSQSSQKSSKASNQQDPAPNLGTGTRWGMAQDMRYDGYDPDSRSESPSLADYIKPQKQKQKHKQPKKPAAAGTQEDQDEMQRQQEVLALEFPNVDTALIAGILIDYPSTEEARTVLKGLNRE